MPYEIRWQQEQRILYEHFYGDVTVEEISELNTHTREFFHPLIHIIVDLSDITRYPTNLVQIRNAVGQQGYVSILGWVVICGTENPFIRFLVTTATQLTGEKLRIRLAATVDEAVAFLHNRDESLIRPVK